MTLLCNFLNILQKLNSREKSSGRMLFGMKIIFPLEKIRSTLKNMDDFFFLKQEIVQFLTNVYTRSKKLNEKEVTYIMLLFKEILL